jgi:hypothetical protein
MTVYVRLVKDIDLNGIRCQPCAEKMVVVEFSMANAPTVEKLVGPYAADWMP